MAACASAVSADSRRARHSATRAEASFRYLNLETDAEAVGRRAQQEGQHLPSHGFRLIKTPYLGEGPWRLRNVDCPPAAVTYRVSVVHGTFCHCRRLSDLPDEVAVLHMLKSTPVDGFSLAGIDLGMDETLATGWF